MFCMKDRRLTLDTNILVYAMDRDAGARHDLALEIVDRAVASDCVLTLQSLCEFYAAVTGKGKMPHREAEAQVRDWLELFPVVSATPKSLTKALKASRGRPTHTIDPSGDAFRAMHHSSHRVVYGLSYEEVKEHSLSFWDAMVWAVADEAGVTLLLSEGFQHTRRLGGTQFCNPFALNDPLVQIFQTTCEG